MVRASERGASVQVTIWHNNIGRPIPLWDSGVNEQTGVHYPAAEYEGRSGISPFYVGGDESDNERFAGEFARTVDRYGAAIVVDNGASWRGMREHDDADWAESRFREGSMCAYYENGEAWGPVRLGGRKGIEVEGASALADRQQGRETVTRSDRPPLDIGQRGSR